MLSSLKHPVHVRFLFIACCQAMLAYLIMLQNESIRSAGSQGGSKQLGRQQTEEEAGRL